jgi:hypothetical protein
MRLRVFNASLLALLGIAEVCRGDGVEDEMFASDSEKSKLVAGTLTNWNKVLTWRLEYEAISSKSSPRPSGVHKIMAASDPGEFYHYSGHFLDGHRWQDDPYRQEMFIHEGAVSYKWPFNRAFQQVILKEGDFLPGSSWRDIIFAVLPTWPIRRYKVPDDPDSGGRIILNEALVRNDYHLLRQEEVVGLEQCVILDYRGTDRIWLSRNKGLALVRREWRARNSNQLARRLLVDKFSEFYPGLWLPVECRVQLFDPNKSGEFKTPERENVLRILSLEIRDRVPKASFMVEYGPGFIRYDADHRFAQTTPGGESLLDDFVEFGLRYAHLPTLSMAKGRLYSWGLVGLLAGCGIGLLGSSVLRRSQHKATLRARPL